MAETMAETMADKRAWVARMAGRDDWLAQVVEPVIDPGRARATLWLVTATGAALPRAMAPRFAKRRAIG